ncbi:MULTISPECIES: DUF1003 domain-containing protein [Pseudonocardiaceae]|uniref:DUF1003 domain-containing protein n=1 Tax=Pseudonocardiaceae TaxID=2070 RepID=UPI001E552146|nr:MULTISPECIES: DUF1003 domain-containing protein [Pseudonocardiaceae]
MVGHRNPANQRRYDQRTTGERLADQVTARFGSWAFICAQSAVVVAWIAVNLAAFLYRWDPYPFILLNLLFSTQAAYAAPLLLLSQNRQAERDRIKAEHDYRINQLALQFLIAWHRDAHPPGCDCVRELGPAADDALAALARDLDPLVSPPVAVAQPAATPDRG